MPKGFDENENGRAGSGRKNTVPQRGIFIESNYRGGYQPVKGKKT